MGGKDKKHFAINGDRLITNGPLDYELKSEMDLIIRVTDSGKISKDVPLPISVTNVNDGPTDILLNGDIFPENQEIGTDIGTFALIDADAHQNSNSGIGQNQRFQLVNKHLSWKEAQSEAKYGGALVHTITSEDEWNVMVNDIGGEDLSLPDLSRRIWLGASDEEVEGDWRWITGEPITYSRWFGDQPDNLGNNQDYLIVQGIGGNWIWDDVGNNWNGNGDINNLRTLFVVEFPTQFSLVEGSGDTDNSSFTIEGNQLKTAAEFNYEAKSKYTIRVKGTDSGGLSIEKSFIINATNIPEAPTAITLDNNTVEENLKKGATVGRLSTTDEDSGEKHTYKLVDAPEGETNQNDRFTISGTTLRTNDVFDFDAVQEQTVHVEVTDRGKLTFVQALTIQIVDANDPPTGLLTGTDQRG